MDNGGEGGRVQARTALVAAQRILALATESLDMMRNVTGVMKDNLDPAELFSSLKLQQFYQSFLFPNESVVYGLLVLGAIHKWKTPILLNMNHNGVNIVATNLPFFLYGLEF